jgi:hypothetical protein
MTRWDSDRTLDRMTDILHPERKKKQESPFGAIMQAIVPDSPRKKKKKNASKKSKRGVQVRKQGKGIQA